MLIVNFVGCALSSAAFLESRYKESANENRAKLA